MLYVNDVLLFFNSENFADEVTDHFSTQFEITISTTIDTFPGFTVVDEGHCMKLHDAPIIE